ncbi:MAG: purine-binding chemotaxis protein CheW [Deltaproteobacteria bacterium]|nr:purine-binding chemotaxis protein CheW [Deltaproteobacteria bacterium]
MPSGRYGTELEMKKEIIERKEKKQILVFHLANEELGLDISCVREVLRPQKIFHLPSTPQFIEGVINLRGHIVALINLKKRLHKKQIEDELNKKIIVCKVNKFIVGLTVDRLREIVALSKEDFKPTPEVVSMQMEAEVLSGIAIVGERIIPILNVEHILTQKEVEELSTIKP